jgi:hypothetical protein
MDHRDMIEALQKELVEQEEQRLQMLDALREAIKNEPAPSRLSSHAKLRIGLAEQDAVRKGRDSRSRH